MKKILAWALALVMVIGLFAGCTPAPAPTDPPVVDPTDPPAAASNLDSAMEYLEAMYKDAGEKTPKDFVRPASVPYGTERYAITWTTNTDEVKVVDNGDGTVTIDVNEAVTEDTAYELTATMADAQGKTLTYTWKHLLPGAAAAGDQTQIVEDAYALENGASMGYEVTLTGKIVAVNTPYAADYKNVTVTIAVPGAEDKPIMCYRLKGEGADIIDNGWTITVTGTIKNYNGTIEFDAGCTLDSYVEGEGVKQPENPVDVVNAAYELKDTETLPYTATLTGVITEIDSPYSPDYGNISVVIAVAGAEDKPILCYRMKGTGVEDLYVGDTITVKGLIKNYKGTIEFDTGCQLMSVVPGERVQAPTDPYEILDAAYALGRDESLPFEVTLSGIVTTIDEPYSEEYNNITVTITIPGRNDQPIKCYRMKGDGIANIKPSDTITVKGMITNYEGIREFKTGCQMIEIVEKGPGYHAPDTQEEIVEHIKTLPITCTLLYKAELTGEIVKVNTAYSSKYGNITVTIGLKDTAGEDFELKIYRLKGDDIDKIKKGDTITVAGYVTNYVHDWSDPVNNSELEMINATLLNFVPGEDTPAGDTSYPTAPATLKTNTPYKLVMIQGETEKVLVFNGKMSGSYLGTTTNAAEYVDVYVEEVDGGYRFYFMDGTTKKYIELYVNSSNKVRPEITTTPDQVWKYDAESKLHTITLKAGSYTDPYYLGTYSTYDTISSSSTYYVTGENAANYGVSQFAAILMEEVPAWDFGGGEEGGEEGGATAGSVANPVVGTAYKLGMQQNNLDGDPVLYVTGKMDGYYYQTTEDIAAAKDIYLEEATGGYHMYYLDGTTKVYLNVIKSGTHNNVKYQTLAENGTPNVWTLNTQYKYLTTNSGTDKVYLGTYSSNDTIGASYTSYISDTSKIGVSQFCAWFYGASESTEPTYNSFAEMVEAANGLANDATLGVNITKTGVVANDPSYNSTHNSWTFNITIEGKTLKCHSMEVAGTTDLNKGDTVQIVGDLSAYNGAAQFNYKCATATWVSGSTTPEPEPDPEPEVPAPTGNFADFDTIVPKSANGDSSYTNTYTTTNGWVTKNSAIQTGGTSDANPQFKVIGSDNSSKAVCMNGKTSAPGSITSPVLSGGISKLTINYTKMFTDTVLKVTIKITDKTTNEVYTNTLERSADKTDKYNVWTYVWELETPVTGDFTIELVNACPSNANSNKDRITILDLMWEGAAPAEQTVSDTIANIADANAWANSKQYKSFKLGEDITVTSAGTDQNTGKYYTNGENWRLYQTGAATLTIDAGSKTIKTVKITYSSSNTGALFLNGAKVESEAVVEINASSVTFNVANTGSATNGQARITAIEVVYA